MPKTYPPEQVADLQKRYDEAVAKGRASLAWNGQTLVTDYAKYVLEFLTGRE